MRILSMTLYNNSDTGLESATKELKESGHRFKENEDKQIELPKSLSRHTLRVLPPAGKKQKCRNVCTQQAHDAESVLS